MGKARKKKNGSGLIEIVDEVGKVVATQKAKKKRYIHPNTKKITTSITIRSTEILLTEARKRKIIELVLQHKYRKQIAKALNVCTSTLSGWLTKNPEFRREMEEAEKMRAPHWRDRYAQVIEETKKKSQVPVNKLKMVGYQKLAEWDGRTRGEKEQQNNHSTRTSFVLTLQIHRLPIMPKLGYPDISQ